MLGQKEEDEAEDQKYAHLSVYLQGKPQCIRDNPHVDTSVERHDYRERERGQREKEAGNSEEAEGPSLLLRKEKKVRQTGGKEFDRERERTTRHAMRKLRSCRARRASLPTSIHTDIHIHIDVSIYVYALPVHRYEERGVDSCRARCVRVCRRECWMLSA